jgi:hypothetical protein
VRKAKPLVGITYAAAVMGEKAMASETQAAGEGVSKSDFKWAKSMAIVPGDHAQQQSATLVPQYQ